MQTGDNDKAIVFGNKFHEIAQLILRSGGARAQEIWDPRMLKSEIARRLHEATEFRLFNAGSWPADRDSTFAFWRLLIELGVVRHPLDRPHAFEFTALGLELNVELICVAAGVICFDEIPLHLDLMGYLNDEESAALYGKLDNPEQEIRRYVVRAYEEFCNRSVYLN